MGLSGEASSLRQQFGKLVASTELKRRIGVNPILPPVPADMIEPIHDVRSFSAATDEAMERADLRRYLREQMFALPEFQRQALELSFFRGMSHREIAASTRNPLGTVKTRLELGLQKLHAWLKPVQHKI